MNFARAGQVFRAWLVVLPGAVVTGALAASAACAEDVGPAVPAPASPPLPPAFVDGPSAEKHPPPSPGAPALGAPKSQYDRELHDFGLARQEQELKTEFRLTNTGDAPLKILDVRANCGCAGGTVDSKELAPGATVVVSATLRTQRQAGKLTKHVIVTTNDPTRPRVELGLRVDVAQGVVLVPARLFFGDVALGTAPSTSMRVQWREGVGTPVRVTGIEAPGVEMTFAQKPFDSPPWHGVEITGTFSKPPPVGSVNGTAILRTDAKDEANARIALPIQAFVSGRVWLDRRAVTLGIVPAGKSRQIAVVCKPFSKDVELGEVTASSRKGRVEAKAIRSGKDWVVTITLPEDAPAGRVDDVVEVKSSIPGEPPAEVTVTGTVLEALK